MTDKEKNLIKKFLNIHYSNLAKVDHLNGQFVVLGNKNKPKKLLIYEQKHNITYLNSEMIIYPISNMFNTNYEETYEFVKNWLKIKYNIDCDNLVGLKPD